MKKNRVLAKATAMVLVIMTVMSVFSMNLTASAMDMESASKKAGKAIITTGVGKIPVIGAFAKSALDPILSELFGIKSENAEILKKLDEISSKLDYLKNTLDKDTQEILKTLNDSQKNEFNKSMTSLRAMVSSNYKFLKEIEISDNSDYAKAVLTAEMLDFNMKNAEQLEVLTESLTEYVKGTEFKTSDTLNIYDFIYRVKCDGSVLGGEAAMKASTYINSVNEIITASYKLMALVLGEKIYVSDNYNSIMEAAETDTDLRAALNTITSEDLAKYSIKVYRNYWSDLLEDNYTKEYNAVYSLDNPDSTVSKYNQMVLDNWFTYIRGVRYGTDSATVDMAYLNREVSVCAPHNCGLDKDVFFLEAGKMMDITTKNIKDRIYSVLTKEELQNLFTHFMSSELLTTDENGNKLSLYDALKDYGFTFNVLEKEKEEFLKTSVGQFCAVLLGGEDKVMKPVFAYEANSIFAPAIPVKSMIEATASYTGYDGIATSLTNQTVTYYHQHWSDNGMVEDGTDQLNVIAYFTAA